ncbi:hypothetical protein EC973_004097, partial [Apophysomyces ossiformis]
ILTIVGKLYETISVDRFTSSIFQPVCSARGAEIREATCKMYQFTKKLPYVHPAHSFVLDVQDGCWEAVFTKEELRQLQIAGQNALPKVPASLKLFFSQFSDKTTVEDLWTVASKAAPFDPAVQFDEDWAVRCVQELLSMYRRKVFERVARSGSERDFVVRLWRCLDLCFDNLGVETLRVRGDLCTNEPGPIHSNCTGREEGNSLEPDLILMKDELEYGCAEVGAADEGEVGKKEVLEGV